MPDPNPSERLAEIEARVEGATEGPWSPGPGEAEDDVNVWDSAEVPSRAVAHDIFKDGDRDFIAHARSDIPWLLEREKKLRRHLAWALCAVHFDLLDMQEYHDARAALADSGEASGEAAESTDDQPPREDGAYDPRPDPRTHPEFWTE